MNIRLYLSLLLFAGIAFALLSSAQQTSAQVFKVNGDRLELSVDDALNAVQLPAIWIGGGIFAGNDGVGQAGRMTVDLSGNIAIVSGPAYGRDLAVTSYTSAGVLRWRRTIAPSSGTYVGDWAVASPNGDITALGRSLTSSGLTSSVVVVRYSSDGTFLWRVDSTGAVLSSGRLLVDAGGRVYFSYNSVLYKYSQAGILLWSTSTSVRDSASTLSPDGTEVVMAGAAGGNWRVAAFDTATGTQRWLTISAEGPAATDVVVDADRVYVAGQGTTGVGTPAITQWMTLIAYDIATGAKIWRTDKRPVGSFSAVGLWMARALDGSIVVTGQTNTDWYTVAYNTNGTVRWEAVRNETSFYDETPTGIIAMANGTTVVTGRGGPALPGGFWAGYTVGYSQTGTLLWEARSQQATVWASALPNGDVCATGGYDALMTCWRPSGGVVPNQPPIAVISANPLSGPAPLTVTFNGSGSTDPDGSVTAWYWSFGDGASGSGPVVNHTYTSIGTTYYPSLTVVDNRGASTWIAGSPIVVNAPPPPAAPSLLTASISGASVVLNWQDNATDELGFYIERCEGAGCTDFQGLFGDTPANVSTFTDPSVVAGTTYRYRVVAYNVSGYSPYSNIASVGNQESAPTNLAATGRTPTSIRLVWTNGASIQSEIRIERCSGARCTNFVEIAVVAGTASNYINTALVQGTYRYRLRAFNSPSFSPYSNIAKASTVKKGN